MGRSKNPEVAIIMGSDSDLGVMKEAAEVLEAFGVAYELTFVSAHRTPDRLVNYCRDAHKRGIRVIIAGAGGAAHLPGMAASLSPLPVIGVPIRSAHSFAGMDSLLSIVQMPQGVPVATVAVNGAANAGLLAIQILYAREKEGLEKILAYKEQLKRKVYDKCALLERIGYRAYLKKQAKNRSVPGSKK